MSELHRVTFDPAQCGGRPCLRGLQAASDAAIWDYALQHDAAIVTKDEDFAQRHALTGSGPRAVWIRLRNTRQRDLPRWIETALPNIVSALEQGETLIEVV